MKKLNQSEISALCLMMERAIKHEQLTLSVEVVGKTPEGIRPITSFGTTDLFGACDAGDFAELIVKPSALKWMWVRYAGYLGGAKKAANAKKRKAR
jgi:hypothetical protein